MLPTFILALAQAATQVTVADYERADRFLAPNEEKFVFRDRVDPHWIGNSDRFWYRVHTEKGYEFIYVDPSRRLRRFAFDHARLASALGRAADTTVSPDSIPAELEWIEEGKKSAVVVAIRTKSWRCDLGTYICDSTAAKRQPTPGSVPSPDGKWEAFIKDHNLWVRSVETKTETALTTDGVARNDYATSSESNTSFITARRYGRPSTPGVLWSPNSKRILTHRLDQRAVAEMYLVQSVRTDSGVRPKLWSYAYPLPGDTVVALATWVIADIDRMAVRPVRAPAMPVTYEPPIPFGKAWWDENSATAYYLDTDRWARSYRLVAIDAATAESKELIEEKGPTMVEANLTLGNKPNIKILKSGREAVWFSERDGWAHLYLYRRQETSDAAFSLEKQLTKGQFVVRDLIRVDETGRTVWFTAGGRESGRDPYYAHLYSVKLDGTGLTLHTPDDADHEVKLSPTGAWVIDRASRVDMPPVTLIRSADNRIVLPLETTETSRLVATGWRPPERFVVKAADGITDIYGILLRPSRFDSTRKYPVIEEIYPGPQATRVPKAFHATGNHQALAELGFVGIQVDGRGTPYRSKEFHNYSYGHLENGGGLEDHVAALRQLAARYPFIDLDRVGIYGHSGGGFASTRALFMYPDVYKVAVSSAGNHDQRGYLAIWGENYQGPLAGSNYVAQANPGLAKNLKGKLLLAFGDMDDNVPPALTIQVIDALTKANKDYDLLILPNSSHGFESAGPYFQRRRWDYFVRHLLGQEPPAGYEIKSK